MGRRKESGELPKIYTLDSETDPFKHGRKPKPFAWGLYSNDVWEYTYGRNCTEKIMAKLYGMDAGIVYLHNGGRFDIFYLLRFVDTSKPMLIIKTRITVCYIKCHNGWHELRDSYKILPFPLSAYEKDEIDYSIFESKLRNKPANKSKIISYLNGDCRYLWELCTKFLERFGNNITIGGTAIKELKKFYDTGESLSESVDEFIRGTYYLGARVECFKKGIVKGKVNVYDVNSMYPFVMANMRHPIGLPSGESRSIERDTFFVSVTGTNYGAFPLRTKQGIKFDIEYGTFHVTIHEFNAALELGLFKPERINRTVQFARSTTFANFVNYFYVGRKEAIKNNDKIMSLFYKFLLNNSYGRFSINPRNYFDYKICDNSVSQFEMINEGWEPSYILEELGYTMYQKPSRFAKLQNVAIGASITGGARSVIMRAIPNAVNPLYCDTDSLICERLDNVPISDSDLGAWKLEKSGNKIAIYGRKGYAVFDGRKCIKYACKGVKITPQEIVKAAQGKVIEYHQDAPTFGLDGSVSFIKRHVRLT